MSVTSQALNEASSSHVCPACSGDALWRFVEVPALPALVCDEFETAAEACASATGEISLSYCEHCGLIFNRAHDGAKIKFKPGYSATLAHTPAFRSHVELLANRLINRYQIRDKHVLDIGCGDGYFLTRICEQGSNHGTGIDPTIAVDRTEAAGDGEVTLIGGGFSVRHHDIEADLVCLISVFETFSDPRGVLEAISRMLAKRDQSVLYLEVPNARYMLDRMAIWSLYYEQFAHYTEESLTRLVERSGFEVLDSGSCYTDGQYLYIEATPAGSSRLHRSIFPGADVALKSSLKAFTQLLEAEALTWQSRLADMARQGKKVVSWGSGGKGNTFLKIADTSDSIRYVVDINPSRHGKFLPGMDKQIVSPESLKEYRPDVIIVTNPIYEQEIRALVASMELNCEFLTL